MADTNVNYQTYNGDLPSGNLSYGQLAGLDSSMGLSAGNQPTFIKNGNIYQVKDNGNNTFGLQQIDTVANRQQIAAQEAYKQQADEAITGLTNQQGSLGQQYQSLLATVKGVYDPLINQSTQTAGEALSKRGLTPDSQLYQQQVQGALSPIYGQEAQNSQQIQQGSISDNNAFANAIAQAKLGVAGTSSQLPLQYGSLSLAQSLLPSQIAANQGQAAASFGQGNYYGGLNANQLAEAQLQYGEPFSVQSGVVFNPSSGKFTQAGGGAPPETMALAKKVVGQQAAKRPQASTIGNYVIS